MKVIVMKTVYRNLPYHMIVSKIGWIKFSKSTVWTGGKAMRSLNLSFCGAMK